MMGLDEDAPRGVAYADAYPMAHLEKEAHIDVTIFEGEGEGLLRDLASPTAQQALEQMSTFIHQRLG